MKKIFIMLLITAALDCHAATGSASDAEILVSIIIAIIFLIAGTGYFIDFIKHKIKEARIRRMESKCKSDEDESLDSLIGVVPGAHAWH